MVGTKVDITKLKRAEEAIRDNEAKLQASNEEIHLPRWVAHLGARCRAGANGT